MLKQLSIRNYALIRQLELSPSSALNIVTGETGAGKSIMLGAIGLLMGNRADPQALLDKEAKCVVEGSFDVSSYNLQKLFAEHDLDFENPCVIRREISPKGKSRAFVNDTPVTLDVLRALGHRLLDIHSQHDTLQLGSNEYQLSLLDNFAQNQRERASYATIYREYRRAEAHLRELTETASRARQELEFHQFQLAELQEARLRPGEQERLEEELEKLEHTEEIKEKLNVALQVLDQEERSAVQHLQTAGQSLGRIGRYASDYQALADRLQSCLIELQDVVAELEAAEAEVSFEPERAEAVQERLSTLFLLQKKHHVTSTDELIALARALEKQVNGILDYDEQIAEAQNRADALGQQLETVAEALSASRRRVVDELEGELCQLLKDLGMPAATVQVQLTRTEPSPDGTDVVTFLFSANKGVAPQSLKNVASGGEFARLMMSIKYVLAGKTALPTVIFDEIDTGISGEIAIKMGKMMQQMGLRHQVLAITHLPQIAARGHAHYYVYKETAEERTFSNLRLLDAPGRVAEIAQMISGEPPTETSLRNARELIEDSQPA